MNLKKAQETANKNNPENGNKKKAAAIRSFERTKQFRADWQAAQRSGKQDMSRVKEAMLLLIANDGSLPPEWLDHDLARDGDKWKDYRELHVKGDLLLVYMADSEMVTFVRLGTHSQLFGK